MSFKSIFIVGAALLASAAFAQESLGTVENVQGIVTDTEGDSVSSTNTGEPIHDGERFVTSSSGSVTLKMNNGCTITLQPNQAVTIDSRMTCRELLAAITPVGGANLAAAGGSAGKGLLAVSGLALFSFAVIHSLESNPSLSGQ